jgi:hypothetical protein
VDGVWLVVSRLVRSFPRRVRCMVEEETGDAPIPASGDGAGGAEGGAAPGPKNRETANWPE